MAVSKPQPGGGISGALLRNAGQMPLAVSPAADDGKKRRLDFGLAVAKVFSADECAKIIKLGTALTGEEGVAVKTGGKTGKETRDSHVAFLDFNPAHQWIYERLFAVVHTANGKHWGFDLAGAGRIQFTAYGPAQHYDWHVDLDSTWPANLRKLSVSVLLNDPKDFSGGAFETRLSDSQTWASKHGGGILFPSYVEHRVQPVTKGTRYSLVAWIVGDTPFR